MKKFIIVLTFLFLIIIIINLDFLFFKVKVCNKLDKNISVLIHSREKNILNKVKKYFFKNYIYDNGKTIYLGEINKKSCSNFYNISRLDKFSTIKIYLQKDENSKLIECGNYFIDIPENITKMDFGNYILNINSIEYKNNNCDLNFNFVKEQNFFK